MEMFVPYCVHTKKSQKLGTNELILFWKKYLSCYAFFSLPGYKFQKITQYLETCLDQNEKEMDQKSHCAAVIVQNPFFNVLHKQTRCLNAQVDLHTSGP